MSDEFTDRISEALKRARETAGISQTEAAKRSGIHQTTISDYENGHSEPRLRNLASLAAAYGAKTGDLVDALNLDHTSLASVAARIAPVASTEGMSLEERLRSLEARVADLENRR
jgi:transcriptional regulator with XRE-family HTH domain